jgi:hypothetical protein
MFLHPILTLCVLPQRSIQGSLKKKDLIKASNYLNLRNMHDMPRAFRTKVLCSMFQNRAGCQERNSLELKCMWPGKKSHESLFPPDFSWTLVLSKAKLCKLTDMLFPSMSQVLSKHLLVIHSTLAVFRCVKEWHVISIKVSQLQHFWVWPGLFFFGEGAVLCIVGSLVMSLASTH